MNFLDLVRLSVNVVFAVILICRVADAQITGAGTSGATDGSGRGTGSAGVQAGGGPDTQHAPEVDQAYNAGAKHNVTTTTTTPSEKSKKQSQKTRKQSKKAAKHSQTSASPSPSASPH